MLSWARTVVWAGHSRVRAESVSILAHGSFPTQHASGSQCPTGALEIGALLTSLNLLVWHARCFSRRSCMLLAMFWMDGLFLASALGPVWSRPGFTSPVQLIGVVMRALAETDPGSEGVVFLSGLSLCFIARYLAGAFSPAHPLQQFRKRRIFLRRHSAASHFPGTSPVAVVRLFIAQTVEAPAICLQVPLPGNACSCATFKFLDVDDTRETFKKSLLFASSDDCYHNSQLC